MINLYTLACKSVHFSLSKSRTKTTRRIYIYIHTYTFIYLFLFDYQSQKHPWTCYAWCMRTVNAMYMYTVFPSSSISFPLSPSPVPTFGALCFGSRSLFRALTTSRNPLHFCTNTRAFIINVQRRITIFT